MQMNLDLKQRSVSTTMVFLFLITFKCFIRFFHFATLSVYFLKVRCLSLKETNDESNRRKKQGNEGEKKDRRA